jgi:hypothetical protein
MKGHDVLFRQREMKLNESVEKGDRTNHQTLGTLAIAFGESENAKSLTTANKRETSEPMLQFDTIIPPAK